MPKKRKTRKQKENTKHSYSYSLSDLANNAQTALSNPKTKQTISNASLYHYDVNLIIKDLWKTVVISGIILTIEIIIYRFW